MPFWRASERAHFLHDGGASSLLDAIRAHDGQARAARVGRAPPWPANRRVLYNRASCDVNGKPFNPGRKLIAWNGTAWGGADVPDYKLDEDPSLGMGPFIMNADGVGRFFARGAMAEGPFPEHYEPFETPLATNPLSPGKAETLNNPAARVFKDDRAAFGKVAQFPHIATTYRLTEHFHFWTQHSRMVSR